MQRLWYRPVDCSADWKIPFCSKENIMQTSHRRKREGGREGWDGSSRTYMETEERAVHASAGWRPGDVGTGSLGCVSDDEQPQKRTPRNSSLLTPIHLSFELSFDWMESVHVLPERHGAVCTLPYCVCLCVCVCVCVCTCPVTVTSHLNLIR